MASQWTDSLKIQLMQTGENATTWGNVTNDNLEYGLEQAIVGTGTVTFASNNQTLSLSNSNASQTARNLRLNLTGTTGGSTRTLTVPDVEKVYIINNTCADAVQVANSTGSNVSVPAGKTMWVYSTGTNVVDAVTHLSSLTLGAPLPIAQGGTGSNLTTYANLQSNVSGILPVANGGTGSAVAAFNGSLITNLNATAISSGVIANTYTTANVSNSSDTLVVRDTGGNFSANTITANLIGNVTGNASTATALSSASGAAPSYSIRAWVNFSALGGSIIVRGSGNVSSVTRSAAGTYSITFATPLPDANYAISGFCTFTSTAAAGLITYGSNYPGFSTLGFDIKTANSTSAALIDPAYITLIVVR